MSWTYDITIGTYLHCLLQDIWKIWEERFRMDFSALLTRN